jgi:hypothetical protein
VPQVEGQPIDRSSGVVLGSSELTNFYALVQQRLKLEKQEWLTKRTNREVEFKAALAKGKKIALLLSIPNFAQSRERATITITSDIPSRNSESSDSDSFDLTSYGVVRFDDGRPHQVSRNSNPFVEAKVRITYAYSMAHRDGRIAMSQPVEMVVLLDTGEIPWWGLLTEELEDGAIKLHPNQ